MYRPNVMIWSDLSFFKMMIYDLECPPEYPPCQQIKVIFRDHQDTHFVSTLINLETYLQSLRSLTSFPKSQFMEFVSSVLITTNNNRQIDLSDINQISTFFQLKVEDVYKIEIRNNIQRFECPVCLEDKMFPVSPFHCQHFICGPCLDRLRNSLCLQSCPLCRSSCK